MMFEQTVAFFFGERKINKVRLSLYGVNACIAGI